MSKRYLTVVFKLILSSISVLKSELYILVITLNLESLAIVTHLTFEVIYLITVLVRKHEYQNDQGCAHGEGGGQGNQILVLVKK